jgi:ATP-dependent RNA helicase HelY
VHRCPERAKHLRAHRKAVRLERDLHALEQRIETATESLARQLDRILAVLEAWGYVEGWTLTARGERLAATYHELDLLVVEAMETGILDDLEVPELAAVASCLTYEHRAREAPEPWAGAPSNARAAMDRLSQLHQALALEERRAAVPETREPDAGFARLAHAWAAGAPLEHLLGDEESLTAGDFVRSTKLLIDLLSQVATLAPVPATRATAASAADALQRGVVAAAALVGSADPALDALEDAVEGGSEDHSAPGEGDNS